MTNRTQAKGNCNFDAIKVSVGQLSRVGQLVNLAMVYGDFHSLFCRVTVKVNGKDIAFRSKMPLSDYRSLPQHTVDVSIHQFHLHCLPVQLRFAFVVAFRDEVNAVKGDRNALVCESFQSTFARTSVAEGFSADRF